MSDNVPKWVSKREVKARVSGLKDAAALIKENPETAAERIDALVMALEKLGGISA